MRIFTLLLTLLCLPLPAQTDIHSSAVSAFIEAAAPLSNNEDLFSLGQPGIELPDTATLWQAALSIARNENTMTARDRAAIVRLVEVAAVGDGAKVTSGPLDKFRPADLEALRDAIGLPAEDDLLWHLFQRPLSLTHEFELETYSIVRIIDSDQNVHRISERTDVPYIDLGPLFSLKIIPADEDPVPVRSGERGQTRHLNLHSIGDLIIAAKAFHAAAQLDGAAKAYALIVASDAVTRVGQANPEEVRYPPFQTHWAALRAVRATRDIDETLQRERERLEAGTAHIAFLARQFRDAANAYDDGYSQAKDRVGRIWAGWGQLAITLDDAENVAVAVHTLAAQLTREDADHARMLLSVVNSLDPEWRREIGLHDSILAKLKTLTPMSLNDFTNNEWFNFHLLFMPMLETMGRSDIAARYLMDKISSFDRAGPEPWRESQMLLWLGQSVSDVCGLVSFQMTASTGWELRPVQGYNRYMDFLHSERKPGIPTEAGEVVVVLDEPGPYGATSPEEDCVTIIAAYGVTRTGANGLAPPSDIGTVAPIIRAVEDWTREARTRIAPAPSAAPFLSSSGSNGSQRPSKI